MQINISRQKLKQQDYVPDKTFEYDNISYDYSYDDYMKPLIDLLVLISKNS